MTDTIAKPEDLDRLKSRIDALRAKTIDNGCTEEEALSAAAKAAELLDRYGLTLSDVEIRNEACTRAEIETGRKRRNSLAGCISAIADFCDCRAWRETTSEGNQRYVFFGLKQDVAVAEYLCDLIDTAMHTEWLRYKTTKDYLGHARRSRTLASSSFLLGMAQSIAEKLDAIKAARDQTNLSRGRDLVVVKHDVVDGELAKLGLRFKQSRAGSRMISAGAHEAGQRAGGAVTISQGIDRGNG